MSLEISTLKVSIIIPAHNRGHFLAETLASIVAQSHKNWECIIVDDASKDNTAILVSKFTDADDRFKYKLRPADYKSGPSGTRNCGIDLAGGDYIQFCDDDDILHPENLSTTLNILETNKKYDFCWVGQEPFYGDFHYIFSNKENFEKFKIGIDHLYDLITNKLRFGTCRVIWKKELFKTLRFNEDLQYAEDWEISQRLLSMGIKGVGVTKTLYYARKHGKSNTVEFWSGNSCRVASKIRASKLVINNLIDKRLFNRKFQRFFIQSAIFLKSNELLDYILEKPELTSLDRIKFANLYRFYPMISFLMRLKKQLKKLFKN